MALTLDSYAMRPEWIVCGISTPEGRKRIIASRSLSYAELQAKIQQQSIYGDLSLLPVAAVTVQYDISLTVHMIPRDRGDLVIIEGDTYGACLAGLEIVCTYCGSCIIGTTCKTCGAPRQSIIDKAERKK